MAWILEGMIVSMLVGKRVENVGLSAADILNPAVPALL